MEFQEINLSLLDTKLKLRSELIELIEFIKSFTPLTISKEETSVSDIDVNLKINSRYTPPKNNYRVSRNISIKNGEIHVANIERIPGLNINAYILQNRLIIDAHYNEREGLFAQFLKHLRGLKSQKMYSYIVLVYYLIYIPFFYYLERFRNKFLIHAGAINYNQNGIILLGLGGVGKSTFCLGTQFLDNCKFLSDNLIIHDRENIYSFPEPIALDRKSANILGDIDTILDPSNIASSHHRMFYRLKPDFICFKATPKYLFWLQQGSHNRVLPLKLDKCINNILNINLLANELREYYVFAAALDLSLSKPLQPDDYLKNLTSLLSKFSCYVLEYKPSSDIKTVISETIDKVIK